VTVTVNNRAQQEVLL